MISGAASRLNCSFVYQPPVLLPKTFFNNIERDDCWSLWPGVCVSNVRSRVGSGKVVYIPQQVPDFIQQKKLPFADQNPIRAKGSRKVQLWRKLEVVLQPKFDDAATLLQGSVPELRIRRRAGCFERLVHVSTVCVLAEVHRVILRIH